MTNRPVVLVNPPSPRGRTLNREGFGGLGTLAEKPRGFVYPAQRLAEAAAMLKTADHEVLGLDFVMEERKATKTWKRLDAVEAVIVHVSTKALFHDLQVAESFRRSSDGAPVVVTGVGLDAERETVEDLCPGAIIDAGMTGYHTAQALDKSLEVSDEPDRWPDACYQTMPLGKSRRLPLYHGRGCTHQCDYCPYIMATGRVYVGRSPDRSFREFQEQAALHKPKRVVFRDPLFGLAGESTMTLLDYLAKVPKRGRFGFEIETRPEVLTPAMIRALADAGCVEIKLGIESMEEDALLATHRVESREQAKAYLLQVDEALRNSFQAGISVRPFLMKGMPSASEAGEKHSRKRFANLSLLTEKTLEWPSKASSLRSS